MKLLFDQRYCAYILLEFWFLIISGEKIPAIKLRFWGAKYCILTTFTLIGRIILLLVFINFDNLKFNSFQDRMFLFFIKCTYIGDLYIISSLILISYGKNTSCWYFYHIIVHREYPYYLDNFSSVQFSSKEVVVLQINCTYARNVLYFEFSIF